MKKQNILAINLALRPESPVKIFPVGLAYVLSSVKRAGFDFDMLDIDGYRYSDEEISLRLCEVKWDIVLLGCIVTGYRLVKEITHEIRQSNPNALIIAGNSVASSIPEMLLKNTEVDVAVIGEGDFTIVELLTKWIEQGDLSNVKGIYYKKGDRIYTTGTREVIPDIDSIPSPIYDLFDIKEYLKGHQYAVNDPLPMERNLVRAFPINSSRGCISKCTFCYHCFVDSKYRYRSAKTIVEEIKTLKNKYSINYAILHDDLTFFSKKQIKEFVDFVLSEKLNIYWYGTSRVNLFQEEKDIILLKRMKDSGCVGLGYSLESGDEDILKAMKKNLSVEQFKRQTRLLQRVGIPVATSIVLGYPEETIETIGKTFQICLDLGIFPSSGFLLPQPGTPIYDWALKNDFINDEEEYLLSLGDRQDLRINLTKMSDEQFLDTVNYWLTMLNKELNLGLEPDELIKTKYYRSKDHAFLV